MNPAGHKLSFKSAIETVSKELLLKFAIPNFVMPLTKRTAKIQLAFEELQVYIQEMIRDRTSSYQDHSDLLSNLIAANEKDGESAKLTHEELTGNIFVFLVAGHETTAHSLAFAIGLLALYPEVQEKLFQHVKETVENPTGGPQYSEIGELKYATAVFYEALRMFAIVPIVPKMSVEDTSLVTKNSKGESVVVPIPKGSFVNVVASALHYNPRYWPDPEEFKPERFLGEWPKHAFAPFSMGARSCIGRRFAEVEATAVLSMLARNYRIQVKEEAKFSGETFAQRRARVLKTTNFLTLTPERIPVTFTRRH